MFLLTIDFPPGHNHSTQSTNKPGKLKPVCVLSLLVQLYNCSRLLSGQSELMPENTRLLYGSGSTRQVDLPEEILGGCVPEKALLTPGKTRQFKAKKQP